MNISLANHERNNSMGAIVIKLQDKSEFEFVLKMVSKMKIESTFITDAEMGKTGL